MEGVVCVYEGLYIYIYIYVVIYILIFFFFFFWAGGFVLVSYLHHNGPPARGRGGELETWMIYIYTHIYAAGMGGRE